MISGDMLEFTGEEEEVMTEQPPPEAPSTPRRKRGRPPKGPEGRNRSVEGGGRRRGHFSAEEVEARRHYCEHCGYRAARSNTLKMHLLAVHAGDRRHLCPAASAGCGYRSARVGDLNRHFKAVHGKNGTVHPEDFNDVMMG